MTSTTYTNYQLPAINASWLNDVNTTAYTTVPNLQTQVTNNNNYTDPLAPSIPKTMAQLVDGEEVSLFRFIPVALQAGIVARTDTTDLTTYFQAAIDSVASNKRGNLYIPAGRYHINQVNITSPIKITGSGSSTTLKPIGVFGMNRMLTLSAVDGVDIGSFSIDASRISYPALSCILAESVTNSFIHDINFVNAGGVGVQTYSSSNVTIERVSVNECQVIGIFHQLPVQVVTRNCIVRGVYSSHGIHLQNGNDCAVVDCSTSNITQFGLNLNTMIRTKIVNHRSWDSKLEGINLLDSSYCDVLNPTVFWTGDATWASTDFGMSQWGDVGSSNFNRWLGGTVSNSRKSGFAIADDCQFNTVSDLLITNPNSLNEVQGSAVLLYGSDAKNNVISNITAWANNGFMRYGVYEQNAGGMPTLNHVANVNISGATLATVLVGPTTTYVTVPGSGTLATLAGAETLTNKTMSGPSVTVTGAVSGNTVTATTSVSGATIAATGAVTGGSAAITGALTAGSVATTGAILSSSTSAGVGYAAGARGSVTQLTSKSTAVTLNNVSGTITMNAASLASGASVFFTVNNSTVSATDIPFIVKGSGGAAQSYFIGVDNRVAGAFTIIVTNTTAGALAQAVTIDFAVIKA